MTDAEIKAALVDRSVLALTLWGEARGQGVEGRVAIGCVVRNRLANPLRWRAEAPTVKAICLAPAQFSCWDPKGGGDNYAAVMRQAERMVLGLPLTDLVLRETLFLVDGIVSGALLDKTGSANSYYAPKAMAPSGTVPAWARGAFTVAIGDHVFLRVT